MESYKLLLMYVVFCRLKPRNWTNYLVLAGSKKRTNFIGFNFNNDMIISMLIIYYITNDSIKMQGDL